MSEQTQELKEKIKQIPAKDIILLGLFAIRELAKIILMFKR